MRYLKVPDTLHIVGLLSLLCAGVFATGWKPIVPPADYYATMPTTCVSDCGDRKYAAREKDAVIQGSAESEGIKSKHVWPVLGGPGQRIKAGDATKDLHQAGQHLNFVYKPAEVAYLSPATEIERRKPLGPPLLPYSEVFKKTPTNFYSFKTIVPKPIKTVYFGEPELLNTKLSNDVKFLSANSHHGGDNLKILIQPDDTELKAYRPLKDYHYDEHCTMYKVSFQQKLYYQYVQYKTRIPDLKEFTICLWFRLHNHSHDHSLLSYSAKPHRKDIYMWVSNLEEPGLFYMKVLGQTIFRLNYPIKLYTWYHTCQSWNGHTGEWQVWVNSHRIARGFHNLLVGHKIPGKGIVISGQEHRNFGKNFQEIPHYYGSAVSGLQGEITMLQMYKVALTAGKANNDHRHHHSHHASTTPAPEEESTEEMPTTTQHPLLENGQLKPVNVLELVKTIKTKGVEGLDIQDHDEHHEQPGDYEAFPQPLSLSFEGPIAPFIHHGNNINYASVGGHFEGSDHSIFKRDDGNNSAVPNSQKRKAVSAEDDTEELSSVEQTSGERQGRQRKIKAFDKVSRPVRVQRVKFPANGNETSNASLESSSESYEEDLSTEEISPRPRGSRNGRSRRHNSHSTFVVSGHPRPLPSTEVKVVRTIIKKRLEPKTIVKKIVEEKKEPSKRFLVLADPYAIDVLGHNQYSSLPAYGQVYDILPQLDHGHGVGVDDNPLTAPISSEETSDDSPTQHELAENEVKRIMMMCSGCHADPFRKVAIISWRSTPKKIYSGALLLKAKSECENF